VSKVTIYHNPRCSKSRQTLALLAEQGLEVEVVEYLKTPPTAAELERFCRRMGKQPLELIRRQEPRFKELGLSADDSRSSAEWLRLMADNPILIERPIVVHGARVELGRPPEKVLRIL
jgi:arsenate reductase